MSFRPEDHEDLPASSFWVQNLPPADLRPEESEQIRVRPSRDEDQEIDWDQWYAHEPVWKGQRILALLGFLVAAGAVFLLLNRSSVMNWLAGPEDPPLRLVRPDAVTREQSGREWVALEAGADVQPGSYLKSGEGRTAVLRVRGGGSVRLDRGSGLKVQKLVRREDGSYQVRSLLYVGRAFVRELSDDTLPVETVLTRISPQQAVYEVAHLVKPDGSQFTQVRVFEGKVTVGLARGQAKDVTLSAGQMIQAAPDRLGAVRPLPARDAWETWNLSWSSTESIPVFREPPPAKTRDHERLKLPPIQPLPRQAGGAPGTAPGAAPAAGGGTWYPPGKEGSGRKYVPPALPSQGYPRPGGGSRPAAAAPPPPASSGAGGSDNQPAAWSGPGYPWSGGQPPVVNDSGATSYPSAAPVTNQAPPGY